MRTIVLLCAAMALSAVACGGGDEGTASTASGGSSSGDTTSSGTGSSSGSGSSSSGGFVPSPGADKIVINEINAIGTSEWVEIANTYDKDVVLTGYAVADSVAMVGGPDTLNALRFPAGAVIPAGGYVFVVRNAAAETPPVKHTGSDCLANAASSAVCYYMTWEIGAKTGEFVYFLDGNDQALANAEYPANAVDPMTGGATWARLPDKTGGFAVSATATPGSPNLP